MWLEWLSELTSTASLPQILSGQLNIFNLTNCLNVLMLTLRKFYVVNNTSEHTRVKAGGLHEIPFDQSLSSDPYCVFTYNIQVLGKPNLRLFCDECQRNITLVTFIMANNGEYCVGCFAKLSPFPEHYSVYSHMNYPLIDQHWMSLDELLLLDGFEKWGFGNWAEVKDYMGYNGANFSKSELRHHYDDLYLCNETLLPETDDNMKRTFSRVIKEHRKVQLQDRICRLEYLKSEDVEGRARIASQSSVKSANILGYNQKRKSFFYDLDYDDKAEALLSNIEFRDDDTAEEIELKFKILEEFNRRQTERLKRYEFTIQHHILDIDYRFKQEVSANKYQKEAFHLFKRFTRFQTHEENEETRALIARNNYLKSMIQGLKQCRRKLDKSGSINATLDKLMDQNNSIQRIGLPRKILHLSRSPDQDTGDQSLISAVSHLLKQQHCPDAKLEPQLSIVYRSQNPQQ